MKVPTPKKLPSGNYNVMLRLGGENISITKSSPKECKDEARIIKSEHLAGKRAIRCNETLDIILTKYIDSRRSVLSPSTIAGYETIRKNRFKKYMKKKISDIDDWQAVINAEVKDGLSPKSIRNNWGLVVSAMGYVGQPVPQVQLPAMIPATRTYLDNDQVKIFVAAIHGHPCEIPALLALHSLRRSEILGLTWDKIDLQSNTIRVEGSAVIGPDGKLTYKQTNKTRKSRRVIPIMIPALHDALNAVPKKNRVGLVYQKSPNLIWEQVNYICRKNGLPEPGVHGLRHSFATIAFSSDVGMTEREVMEIGGWESHQVVHGIYEHLSAQSRLKAENKFASFFKSPSENADGNADGTSKGQ